MGIAMFNYNSREEASLMTQCIWNNSILQNCWTEEEQRLQQASSISLETAALTEK
jgi:hypothetical protein